MRTTTLRFGLVACLALIALLPACLSSDAGPKATGGTAAFSHDNVPLLDRLGEPIPVGSVALYSPRLTCGGGCHDIDHAENGYHFQQGRTDSSGAMHVRDDWFLDGRDYVRSDGMYGKW